jgi:UPF0755 protein
MKLRVAAALALAIAAAAGAAWWWVHVPFAGFTEPAFVDIPKGTGTRAIAQLLAEAGAIEHPLQFWLARWMRPGARLKAGEYRFEKPASALQVLDRLASGDVFYYLLPVPEGNSVFDIAAALEREHVMTAHAFLEEVHDPRPIRDLDPQAPSLEGYLFPDTYRVTRHTTAGQLCRAMTERFRKAWQQLGPPQADVHAIVTLASLVEKEARLPEERPVIAGVFLNRLRLDLPLQCDPTTIYAALLEDRYRGAIHRSDLASQQRYNTYQHVGLPPGPIANPGLDSLQAALHPAETAYLYFVARPDGSGRHQFSKELAQHELAVQQYRRGLRKAQQANGTGRVPAAKPPVHGNGSGTGRAAGTARANFR